VLYNDRFFNQLIQTSSAYETTQAQLRNKIHLSRGTGRARCFTWNDYSNGIQELQEFEVAPFIDQAKYTECIYQMSKTHQTKFSQSVILNPAVAKRIWFKSYFLISTIKPLI
jgi:hypothetical protein